MPIQDKKFTDPAVQHFYQPSFFMQAKSGGESSKIELSSYVKGILIHKNFDNDKYPLIKVTMDLPLNIVRTIQSSYASNFAYLSLKILTQKRDGDQSSNAPEDTFKYVFKNIKFVIIGLDRSDIPSNADQYNETGATNTRSIEFPVELFPYDALTMNSKVESFALHNTDTKNIIISAISTHAQTGYKVCLAAPDLERQYRSFNIPHKNFSDFVNSMQITHGIYNSTIITFFDIDKVFVMGAAALAKFPSKETPSELNAADCRIVCITKPDTMGLNTDGSFYDKTGKQAVIMSSIMPRLNFSHPANKLNEGDNFKISERNYADTNMHKCITQTFGSEESLVGSQKVMVSKYDNPTLANQFKFKQMESTSPVTASFTGAHMGIFDPRKKFLFMDESNNQPASYQGYWRLSKVIFNLAGSSGDKNGFLKCVISGEFKPYLGK